MEEIAVTKETLRKAIPLEKFTKFNVPGAGNEEIKATWSEGKKEAIYLVKEYWRKRKEKKEKSQSYFTTSISYLNPAKYVII